MANMYATSDFRKGLKLLVDGDPYVIVDFQHVKPGKGNAFTRTRLKHMISGSILERTWKSGEKFEAADVEEKDMQYLYKDGESFVFMDNSNYEQVHLTQEMVDDVHDLMPENITVSVMFFRERAVGVTLPNFVDLQITKCDPGARGDTATNVTKPATLSTGGVVQVPLFVNEGDVIRIDTRTHSYMERVAHS
ncbi:MAG TPA: elongation factor P [Polyangia bacterium]|jgi:elongation factor P